MKEKGQEKIREREKLRQKERKNMKLTLLPVKMSFSNLVFIPRKYLY